MSGRAQDPYEYSWCLRSTFVLDIRLSAWSLLSVGLEKDNKATANSGKPNVLHGYKEHPLPFDITEHAEIMEVRKTCGLDYLPASQIIEEGYNEEYRNKRAIDSHGQPNTGGRTCPHMCNRAYNPVCGSDGEVYSNPCILKNARECEGKNVHRVMSIRCLDSNDMNAWGFKK
ncbi:unnamed protein product [Cyprideis torosa]|uniref:Uncharacterized protein n=1 Tax=Cyprideis torosa TaxID=163714 RepID=A0A7R8ZLT5_9CRUS|nr:unnamed protein product [Cyprideis torosa]CAG0892598.1 unnamed protein product [Cyprideis torosa]